MSRIDDNARALDREFEWLYAVLDARMRSHFGDPPVQGDVPPAPPMEPDDGSFLAELVRHYQLGNPERVLLALSLAPHLRPELLDVFFTRNTTYDRGFTEFGGATHNGVGPFEPTIDTALFVLAGRDLRRRIEMLELFEPERVLFAHEVLERDGGNGAAVGAARLRISAEALDLATSGRLRSPEFGAEFPARRVSTALEWEDLVLPAHTMEMLEEIEAWVRHGEQLFTDPEFAARVAPGYRSLFCGPPGTGKTLSACMIGKRCDRDVYRIDLSQVVSKWVGETEKNLEKVFRKAQHRSWILFFDEAESLFGKRTDVAQAHDRWANQEVSFLLQRIEDFPGVVILATNLRGNVDPAFVRRFQTVVQFTMPTRAERLRLWQHGFSSRLSLDPDVDLDALARDHELAGGAIVNVIRYCSLQAARRGATNVTRRDLSEGVRRELHKEGKAR